MPAQRDRIGASGGDTAAALSRRLSEAVRAGPKGGANGHGSRNGNGSGPIELPDARDVAIDVCRAILAETDSVTAEHSDDVVLITEAIGRRLGFSAGDADDLVDAARLHDIGKAWLPRAILEKPGPLNDEEWALMRRHTLVGQEILSSVAELEQVGHLVRHSHERWDGGGYPDGLRGADIPLGSRIIFCADAFHAIRCDRPYRAGRSAAEALAEIKRCSGTQFDPTVTAALEEVARERGTRPRGASGTRLFALLMCLVVGGAGTAIARSDLLGDSDPPDSSPPAAIAPGGPLPGSVDPQTSSGPQAHHPRPNARASRHTGASSGGQAGGEQSSSGGASSGGSSGWHGSGKSGSAPGHNKPSGASGPGKSGSAPGHTKPSGAAGSGKSGSAPGHTKPTSSGGSDTSSSNGGGNSDDSKGK